MSQNRTVISSRRHVSDRFIFRYRGKKKKQLKKTESVTPANFLCAAPLIGQPGKSGIGMVSRRMCATPMSER